MKLIFSPDATRTFGRLPRRDSAALLRKLRLFAAEPFKQHPWVSPLTDAADMVRVRQGDWRAIILISRARDVIIVERVGHRREVYR